MKSKRRRHLLKGLHVLVEQQRPRLQQDVERVFLHLVKQLLESRHDSVVNLPARPLINTNGPPGRAEEIGGVEELRGEENKDVITSGSFRRRPALTALPPSPLLTALMRNVHRLSRLLPSHHINVAALTFWATTQAKRFPGDPEVNRRKTGLADARARMEGRTCDWGV